MFRKHNLATVFAAERVGGRLLWLCPVHDQKIVDLLVAAVPVTEPLYNGSPAIVRGMRPLEVARIYPGGGLENHLGL